jgi:hypothetical protein
MRYQELFLSASVLGAAIAPDNCLHDANMRPGRLLFQRGAFCAERADDGGALTMRPPTEAASVFFLKRLFAVSFSLARLLSLQSTPIMTSDALMTTYTLPPTLRPSAIYRFIGDG